jgi:hypothetical protein
VDFGRPLPQKFGDEDEGERAVDAHGRVAEDVRDADVDAAPAQADRVVQAGVRVEADFRLRRRAVRLKLTEGVNEEHSEGGLHVGHK